MPARKRVSWQRGYHRQKMKRVKQKDPAKFEKSMLEYITRLFRAKLEGDATRLRGSPVFAPLLDHVSPRELDALLRKKFSGLQKAMGKKAFDGLIRGLVQAAVKNHKKSR